MLRIQKYFYQDPAKNYMKGEDFVKIFSLEKTRKRKMLHEKRNSFPPPKKNIVFILNGEGGSPVQCALL